MKHLAIILGIMLFVTQTAFADETEKQMKIKMTIDTHIIIAELNNTATAEDFFSKLPLTLTLNNHQNREYYTNIKLDKMAPIQNGYQVGDIGYWGAGNALVFFYDTGYTDNLIILGKIIQGLEFFPHMSHAVSAHIEVF